MGSGGSKPDGPDGQHVFTSQTAPVRFSQELVDSLQTSTESDSTRSVQIEQLVQSRVNAELKRLQASEEARLKEISSRLDSDERPKSTDPTTSVPRMRWTSGDDSDAKKSEEKQRSHETVSKEIEGLKKKLEGRKQVAELDPAVSKAKDEVVKCLRSNDRRPLDCWKEVEAFRTEVGRLERDFVERTVR